MLRNRQRIARRRDALPALSLCASVVYSRPAMPRGLSAAVALLAVALGACSRSAAERVVAAQVRWRAGKLITYIKQRPGVWFATHEQVARFVTHPQ
jgi:hypothetical protein